MYEVQNDYRTPPGFWSRVGSGTANFFTQGLPNFLTDTLPDATSRAFNGGISDFVNGPLSDAARNFGDNALPAADKFAARLLNMQPVPEDEQTFWNRWERKPYEGPGFGEEGYWSHIGRGAAAEVPHAIALGMGVPGGATAGALRAVRKPASQLVRTVGSYAVNRGWPAHLASHGIETGEYAPAAGELGFYLGGLGGIKAVSRFAPSLFSGGRARSTFGGLLGAVGGGGAGYVGVKPLEGVLGGSVDAVPFLDGMRVPGNPDYRYDSEFNIIYDPPLGKDPVWDEYMGRTR